VLLTINSGSSLAGAKNFAICCDSFSGGVIRPYAATVGEVLIYNRVLSSTEIATVERYLAAKWGVTLIVPPTASNADAQAWITAVYGNGGTVSTATANAVNTFCTSIESAGIRSLLWRVNPMAGNSLESALVPLYRGPSSGGTQYGNATDINDNFVSGDYVATSGLIGNGSNKRLSTGLPLNFTANRHLGVFVHTLPANTFRAYIGARGATTFAGLLSIDGGSPTTNCSVNNYTDAGAAGGTATITHAGGDFVLGTHGSGSGTAIAFINGVQSATGIGNAAGSITTGISIFSVINSAGTAANFTNARLGGYTLGENLSGAQSLAYYGIWDTLLRALGRKA
jgi:hypothetical protein